MREQLASQGHLQHLIEIHEKLMDLTGEELDSIEVQRLKAVMESKHKLIDKYLPTEKPTTIEGTGEDGQLEITITKKVVSSGD